MIASYFLKLFILFLNNKRVYLFIIIKELVKITDVVEVAHNK